MIKTIFILSVLLFTSYVSFAQGFTFSIDPNEVITFQKNDTTIQYPNGSIMLVSKRENGFIYEKHFCESGNIKLYAIASENKKKTPNQYFTYDCKGILYSFQSTDIKKKNFTKTIYNEEKNIVSITNNDNFLIIDKDGFYENELNVSKRFDCECYK